MPMLALPNSTVPSTTAIVASVIQCAEVIASAGSATEAPS